MDKANSSQGCHGASTAADRPSYSGLPGDSGDSPTLASPTPAAQTAAEELRASHEWVAEDEAEMIVALGGDGFMLSPIYCPGAIEEFVDLVVPELQRRNLFRTDYSGVTQRDHLLQDD